MTSFICFIKSNICSGGREETAWVIWSGASAGLQLGPYGVSSGGATGPPGPTVPDLVAEAYGRVKMKSLNKKFGVKRYVA